ncbi:MAG: prepilin-type N-terminal cleavage/methylation domain-containing protein [Betaproteobacteria bacterium]|nr:prepilin-type N-terminal cleavage/methylation domain-containing protein [Betaproteobacteria bacterium]
MTGRRGFTLLELLVVLAIIALLLAVVAPSYFRPLGRSKDVVLRNDLKVMRSAIDHYYGDRGAYPASLQGLVVARYLRAVPVDPITGSSQTWIVTPPPVGYAGAVYDVHSGAPGKGPHDAIPYAKW